MAHKHRHTQTDRETDTQTHLPTTSYNRQELGLICHKLIRTDLNKLNKLYSCTEDFVLRPVHFDANDDDGGDH